MDIANKRALEWTLDDLRALVREEVPEYTRLEFKQDLPLADGANGWRTRGKVHSSERDGLAKEIVALSNAYGGAIVVGIEESDDAPKRAVKLAAPLPALHDLSDRLRAALASVIEPPIANLEIAAVLAEGKSSEGYLVISVPASSSAPHGHGRPPLTFVRRDDRSDPATMRDLQDIFWEARARRERIEQESKRLQNSITDQMLRKNYIGYVFYAISEIPLFFPNLAKEFRDGKIMRTISMAQDYRIGSVTEIPDNISRWRPTSSGADYSYGSEQQRGVWNLDQTGILSASGECPALYPPNGGTPQIHPVWFIKALGHVAGMAKLLNSYSQSSNSWILGAAIRSDAPVMAVAGERFRHMGGQEFEGISIVRPFRIPHEMDAITFRMLAEKIWATFHLIVDDSSAAEHGFKELAQFELP